MRSGDVKIDTTSSFPLTMSQPQTINVGDLDVAQLADVRKQLEDVHPVPNSYSDRSLTAYR